MDVNPDFRTRLVEDPAATEGRFRPLRAGRFHLSIQPCNEILPRAPYPVAPEDCDRWDVAVRAADGTPALPSTQPWLFRDGPWRQYWRGLPHGSMTAPSVPTEVVQTLYDFLVLGPEIYEAMTTA